MKIFFEVWLVVMFGLWLANWLVERNLKQLRKRLAASRWKYFKLLTKNDGRKN